MLTIINTNKGTSQIAIDHKIYFVWLFNFYRMMLEQKVNTNRSLYAGQSVIDRINEPYIQQVLHSAVHQQKINISYFEYTKE